MNPAVDRVIAKILEAEGGVADVGDGKGITRWGQTQDWLEDNGFVPPGNAADAAVNYETWFKRTGIHAIIERDETVGHLVADFAVHAGLRAAVIGLQKALGVSPDGVIGSRTIAAINQLAGHPNLAKRIVAERMRFTGILLGSSATDRRSWARGWLNRLAAQVEALP